MSIPKIIHYCWFGGKEKPLEIEKYLSTWKAYLPDYQVIEWNEYNFNLEDSCNYVKQAYACRKWAFVSDYVRLKVLYEYGGIYFDTDVEVVKSFDELLKYKAFIGYESAYSVCTAVIGAEKKSTFVKKILDEYINKDFTTPNGKLNTQPNSKLCFNLIKKFYQNPNVKEVQFFNDVTIFPSDYFSPINCYNMKKTITGNTYSVHYYKSSWKNSQQRFKDRVLALITRLIGEEVREKVKYWIRRI